MTQNEVEILMLDSAIQSQKQRVARCERIADRALWEAKEELEILQKMEKQIKWLRETYLEQGREARRS